MDLGTGFDQIWTSLTATPFTHSIAIRNRLLAIS